MFYIRKANIELIAKSSTCVHFKTTMVEEVRKVSENVIWTQTQIDFLNLSS